MKVFEILTRYERRPGRLTMLLFLPFAGLFVLVLLGLTLAEYRSHDRSVAGLLRESARAYFDHILLTRLWNARHGGVYVPVTATSRPNPYLEDPSRDISAGGREYTKINPAYMTRQISELARERGGFLFHVTSLNPINPGNAPDSWEAAALKSFERGEPEAYGFSPLGGGDHFRYMAPLVTEEACLGCHAKQGYRQGDIRGGISVSIPAASYRSMQSSLATQSALRFLLIGTAMLSGLFAVTRLLAGKISAGIAKELEGERLKTAVEMAGAAAHEMRQPLTVLAGVTELLRMRAVPEEQLDKQLEILAKQCSRMDDILRRMLNITRYRTKNYAGDTNIFDLDNSADAGDVAETD